MNNKILLVELLLVVRSVRIQVLAHVNGPDTFPLPGFGRFWIWLRVCVLVRLIKGVPRTCLCLWLIWLVERI